MWAMPCLPCPGSFRTTLCLQPVSSVDLAAACFNLAANTLKVKIPPTEDGKPWWSRWQVNPEVLHGEPGCCLVQSAARLALCYH